MASTISAATMTVKIEESINLNGQAQGCLTTITVPSVNEVSKRILTCIADADTTIATFAAETSTSAQAYKTADVRYVRVTNLDNTNTINLAMIGASDNYQVVIQPGHSHILGKVDNVMLGEADTSPAFTSFEDLASILVDPGANTVDVELFIASA